MSLNTDVIGVMCIHMDTHVIKTLKVVSKAFSSDIHAVEESVLYWRQRAEHIACMILPFDPDDDTLLYWKDLAINLENTSIKDLFLTGVYEYVYIGASQCCVSKDDVKTSSSNATIGNMTQSIAFLLDTYSIHLTDRICHMIIDAVCDNSNDALKVILEHPTSVKQLHSGVRKVYDVMRHTIDCGNVKAFKILLINHPWSTIKYEVLLNAISMTYENRSGLLEAFISLCPGQYGPISTYCAKTRGDKVSGDEMKILSVSGMFEIDVVERTNNLSPEAAFMLLQSTNQCEYTDKLTISIAPNGSLLDKVLKQMRPLEPYKLWTTVMKLKAPSWQVAIKHMDIDRIIALRLIKDCIVSTFCPQAMIGVCNHVGITMQEIEAIICECRYVFDDDSVESIIKLGVPLRRSPTSRYLIGEKLAFNTTPNGWQSLHRAGFDFNICGTDLIKQSIMKCDSYGVECLLKYVTEYDVDTLRDILESTRPSLSHREKIDIDTINKLLDTKMSAMCVMDVRLRFSVTYCDDIKTLETKILWHMLFDVKGACPYDWLAKVTPAMSRHPNMVKGITIMKRNVENTLLRSSHAYGHREAFLAWLRLARGLRGKVYYKKHAGCPYAIYVGGTVVMLDNLRLDSGKYKWLDLFSNNGIPLTTKDSIRNRRIELQLM